MAKYRVGLIGAGRKGTQHARAYMLDERTELVAVADGDPENLALFQKRTGVPGYADYRQMLEKEALDIAAPILPVSPNPEVVIACAQAGVKAILCEKPIAASLAEADRMVAECKRRRISFGAGDLDVNLPAYQKALEFIGAGELGAVKRITLLGGSGTEMSGGGCQRFTLMRHFAGCAEVAWVSGWVSDDPLSDHDQGGAGYVRFTNGVEAFTYRDQDVRGRGYEVACEDGIFYSDDNLVGLYRYVEGDGASWEKLEKSKASCQKGRSMAQNAGTTPRAGGGPGTATWLAARPLSTHWSGARTRPAAARTASRSSKWPSRCASRIGGAVRPWCCRWPTAACASFPTPRGCTTRSRSLPRKVHGSGFVP